MVWIEQEGSTQVGHMTPLFTFAYARFVWRWLAPEEKKTHNWLEISVDLANNGSQ